MYTLPREGSKTRWQYRAEYYAYPFFLQNWSLFAPAPVENYKLFVEFNTGIPEKQELLFELLSLHRENRFKGYEAIVLSVCNSIHYFEKNTSQQQGLNGPVSEDANFNILERQVIRYLNWKYKLQMKSVKLALYCNNTHSGQKRLYYNSAWARLEPTAASHK
ncbi:MAG TPA: DUF5819 family protein [Bacteroidia bacterium]|nr:DUF5819 family protein [Bacteroidia bacterium]